MRLLVAAALAATSLLSVPAAAAPAVSAAPAPQPYASYWYPNTILTWDPATDPDARFNRSRVPMQPRTQNAALKANTNARAGEGKVASLVSFGPTSNNPSQGSLAESYYAFGYWQYVDTLVFWGGSAGEGLILAPNATVIDAAHRNGVKVYGTVFFPPTAYGGQIQWVRDFVVKSGTRYPVADKLNQVAQHYGFDGWFINQETAGGDAALSTSLRDFMKYARTSPTEFMWYDSMVESGGISWQDALNSSNDSFLQEGSSRVSDSMFLNFNWSSSDLTSSRTNARALGRSEFDLATGIDTEANGYNSSVNWSGLFPSGQPHVTSLGIYRPEWTWKSSANRDDFMTRDARYWTGANGDPSNTTTSSSWKGLSTYIAESTPVTSLPFTTSFNTGQGSIYAVDGQITNTGGWNNLAVQDVLPTYRWLVSSTGTKLTPRLDFTDAYNGGSSLSLSGSISATNTIRLYQTALPVSATTQLAVTLKTATAGATNLSASVSFTDAPNTFTHLPLGSTTGTGWETKTLDLSAYAGKTIAQLGFQAAAGTVNVKVGQLSVRNATATTPAPATFTVDGTTDVSTTTKQLRVSWSPVTGAHHYNVYRRNPDNTRTYLGGTTNDAYFVPKLDRAGTETSTTLEVESVSATATRSTAATTTVPWSGTPTSTNLALNRPATSSTPCNSNESAVKAVNGSVTGGNTDKWCSLASAKWLEVDLGSARTLNQFIVKHAGAGGESTSWNTRAFTIQTRSSTTDPWTTAVTVTANTASTTTHPVTTTARYIRLNITTPTQTTDQATRIYELEAWGT
ncbi:endo-beta-N-acetylglucosaminidase [Longispora albida]|uniref:endo-beta-N-acetylglucosaminidase n=1 Tax=Longispora albida TaxID=203523 RepID=UPI0003A47BEA|nr:discoidin domain-containing protein [Longispora albida]